MNLLDIIRRTDTTSRCDEVKQLIPGDKKSVVVLARRTRLVMVQLLYDARQISLTEAVLTLQGCLSPGKEKTRYDDSKLLQKRKENSNDYKEEPDYLKD